MEREQLPVAVIGAGPVGLAAAAHLAERGEAFVLVEAGQAVGAAVSAWGHVQLFSPWRYLVDTAAARLLAEAGWASPDPEGFPNGAELVASYLAPLAAHPAIAPQLLLNTRVSAVTREGFDKLKSPGRANAPFLLHLESPAGEAVLRARAVIDASGTWQQPNPLGASGTLAAGEAALRSHIAYGIPDVLGSQRARYAGKRVLLAGSGHSAFNTLLELAKLAEQAPGTAISWAVRRPAMGNVYGGGTADGLPARGQLGTRVRALVESGTVRLINGWHTSALKLTADGVVAQAGTASLPPVDELIVATGFRPDLALLRELRLGLDSAVEAPTALAPLIDPNVHSCGSVPPHGVDELAHPEPDFYIVGMKSYGRAPTFLMLTGYEQVRSVVAALAGDWVAARKVELVLPETGVCSGPIGVSGEVACCSTTPATRFSADIALVAAGPSGCCSSC